MAKYLYTLKVTDFTGAPLPGAIARARIRPLLNAAGPDGLLGNAEIRVTLDGAGAGAVSLVASVDTTPQTPYRLIVDWRPSGQTSQDPVQWSSDWIFNARAGGGDIRTMVGAPASALFFTPDWPTPRIPGVYVDLETGFVYRKSI